MPGILAPHPFGAACFGQPAGLPGAAAVVVTPDPEPLPLPVPVPGTIPGGSPGGVPPTVLVPAPRVTGVRDRPILRLIAAALLDTGEFHDVTTGGLPEDAGGSAEAYRLASLEITGFNEDRVTLGSDANGTPCLRTCRFNLTVQVRDPDADARDDEADRLAQVASNAINGKSFGGETFCDLTRLGDARYLPATGPERRLQQSGSFAYDITDYGTRNTEPDT